MSVELEPERVAFEAVDVEGTVPARFDAIVARAPDRVAISAHGRRWTYAELDRRANRIAHAILARTRPGAGCVAYLADHSPDMIACALGVLKAGKVYLCVHPGAPPGAQRELLLDAAPDLLIAAAPHERRAREIAGCDVLSLGEADEAGPAARPLARVEPSAPAVIFYTSGTTGRPKGVVKSHRALLHRAFLSARHDAVGPGDRQSLLTYLSFSTSESDVFGALLNGATLCLFDAASRGLADLAAWIDAERVTVLHPPVVLFRRFLATLPGERLFPSVRLVALAGETVLPSDLERWRRRFAPSCALRHRFSSTEAGHLAVACVEPGDALPPGAVPAGRAVHGKRLSLAGEGGRPLAPGEPGELVVRSAFLALGYWRRPEETAADFVEDPAAPGERTFRTGDLGRFLPDGAFEFLGRRDDQVKIRGYRVQLPAVESALASLPAVRQAAVALRPAADGRPRLVGYVVLEGGPALACRQSSIDDKRQAALDVSALRAGLAALVPEHMIPAAFVALDALPLTPTLKVDRRALPAPASDRPRVAAPYVAPQGEAQRRLAALFEKILGVAPVGIHDDFFDLGGDSLRSIELATELARRLGRAVAPGDVYEARTVAALDARLRGGPGPLGGRTLVPVQPRGGRPPLFCVHGRLGSVARGLAPDQPVYVLSPHGADGRPAPATVEEMARDYVAEARRVQPAGPYYLAGYSAGCAIALEMAQEFRRAGEPVALLLLLDPRHFLGPEGGERGPMTRRVIASAKKALLRAGAWGSLRLGKAVPRPFRHQYWISACRRAVLRYEPAPYDGRVAVFRTAGTEVAPRRGWYRLLTGEVEVRDVAGGHLDMVDPPHAEPLGRLIQERLDRKHLLHLPDSLEHGTL